MDAAERPRCCAQSIGIVSAVDIRPLSGFSRACGICSEPSPHLVLNDLATLYPFIRLLGIVGSGNKEARENRYGSTDCWCLCTLPQRETMRTCLAVALLALFLPRKLQQITANSNAGMRAAGSMPQPQRVRRHDTPVLRGVVALVLLTLSSCKVCTIILYIVRTCAAALGYV